MTAFYLASRVSRAPEMHRVRSMLEQMGHTVTSRWLDLDLVNKHGNRGDMPTDERAAIAESDLHDVRCADITILFSEPPNNGSNGGRLVELGYAMGRNKECWVVGPLENLFMCTQRVARHFPTPAEFRRWLHHASPEQQAEPTATH